MRGLEKNHMGRGHQTDGHVDSDQLGPEGWVGENPAYGRHQLSRTMRIVDTGHQAYSSIFKHILAYSSLFQSNPPSQFWPIPAYFILFWPIPAYFSLFKHFPAFPDYHSLFPHITAYFGLFQPIPAYFVPFQSIPDPFRPKQSVGATVGPIVPMSQCNV